MPTTSTETAILLFAFSPAKEARNKGFKKAWLLFKKMNERTLAEVKRSGFPYFHFDETNQEGGSFGERLSNAIQVVFQQGFKNVIAVGNDCPQLKSFHINQAAAFLAKGKNTLGPSNDDGLNLLGIKNEAFDKKAFQRLPWKTQDLFFATQAYFQRVGHDCALLETMIDVDSLADIKAIVDSFTMLPQKLLELFKTVLFKENNLWYILPSAHKDIFFPIPLNKGSPRFAIN